MSQLYHARMSGLKHIAHRVIRLFEHLLDLVFPARPTELLVRAASLEIVLSLCAPTVVAIDGVPIMTLFPYRTPLIQALITEAKYERNKQAQQLLGAALGEYIAEDIAEHMSDHIKVLAVIVPIPLGKARRKERGYNQVEEIARNTGFPVQNDLLVRIRDTIPQTTLGKEARKQNMARAFGLGVAAAPPNPSTTYILLDDVVTTGATLLAAYSSLRNAGASRILLLALAH